MSADIPDDNREEKREITENDFLYDDLFNSEYSSPDVVSLPDLNLVATQMVTNEVDCTNKNETYEYFIFREDQLRLISILQKRASTKLLGKLFLEYSNHFMSFLNIIDLRDFVFQVISGSLQEISTNVTVRSFISVVFHNIDRSELYNLLNLFLAQATVLEIGLIFQKEIVFFISRAPVDFCTKIFFIVSLETILEKIKKSM